MAATAELRARHPERARSIGRELHDDGLGLCRNPNRESQLGNRETVGDVRRGQEKPNALADAELGGPEISHLVTVSCTGFHAPGIDMELIRALELPPTVARTHVGFMGCHGAFNGLRVASAFAAADPDAVLL